MVPYHFQDLAFIPIQVLLVTIIVDQVPRIRERTALLKKPNMVIGTFPSTELLWAVFHLVEELAAREDLQSLARPAREHLAGDIKRVFVIIVAEWLSYMRHLQKEYPSLFSLAVRTNPFDPRASAAVC